MKRAIIGVGIVAVLVVGVLLYLRLTKKPETAPPVSSTPVEVAPVGRGDVDVKLSVSGSIEADRKVSLSAKMMGRVTYVAAEEGQPVQAGQVVVRIDSRDYAAMVAQAEAGVQAANAAEGMAKARLAAVEAGARPQERRQAELAVAQARAGRDNAEVELRRAKDLFAQGALARQQLEAAQTRYDVAQATYDTTEQQLNMVQEGARAEDVQTVREQVKQAAAAVAQARAALHAARLQVSNTVVTTPIGGIVSNRQTEVGETAGFGTPLLDIVDNRRVWMRGLVSESDVRKVRRGQSVAVTVDALAGREFTGEIADLLPSADARTRMFTVRIRIANPLGELKDGMFARALIATERRQNVLVIPRSAVIVRGEGRSAVVAVDGKATIRALTLGPEDGDLVQVVAGLQEGDNIVIRGQQDLQAGESISVKAKGSR